MDLTAPFAALFSYIGKIATWCLDGILWLLGKAFFLPFDGLLTCISTLFKAIDLSSFLASYVMNWVGLPPQMIWFVNAVGIPSGVAILTGAIGIRMALNLIPAAFTRI